MPEAVPEIRRRFGRALASRRRAAGLSQERLGLDAGLSTTYVAMLERGEKAPTLTALVALAAPLGCAAWQLVKEAEEGGAQAPDA